MKIIGLAGSPRRGGNSDALLDALLDAAKAEGATAEKVYLNGLAIKGCQACYGCKKTGRCKLMDDMRGLLDKLIDADAWVFATPVYWWGPSAQMKLAIDRMFPLCHEPLRAKVKGKRAVLITTSEDAPAAAAKHLKGMFREAMAYLEVELAPELLVRAYQKGDALNNPTALAKAARIGRELVRA